MKLVFQRTSFWDDYLCAMKVAVIGGGAAGFFAAIHVKLNFPDAQVSLFEKSNKVLAKVKISGGGRCNVTNAESSISELSKAYPRGGKLLKKLFPIFHTKHTIEWFEKRGVPLVKQDDQCIFPQSQDSQSIIDCFLSEAMRLGVAIRISSPVKRIHPIGEGIELVVGDEQLQFDRVIVTTGGSPKRSGLQWLETLGHQIEEPVPSLFTFNMPTESLRTLMGVVVERTITTIKGTKLKANGPLLITHWGMSGPAILILSAFGARILQERNYQFTVSVNWVNETNHERIHNQLNELMDEFGGKQLKSIRPYYLPARLWEFLLEKYHMNPEQRWSEIGKKGSYKITTFLTNDEYTVQGKTTFKEEFVTCGGVSLASIHPSTLESKVVPGLFFAGEVLDIDAITGGYNFQAAWTTGYIAGKLGI